MIAIFALARKKARYLLLTRPDGIRNVVADFLSRMSALESQLTLDGNSFQWFLRQETNPLAHLFATQYNHQLPC